MTTHVLIHKKFEDSYGKLDGSIKDKVLNFIVRLQREPDSKGLDLKHPKGAQSYIRTARVTYNYRAVLAASGADDGEEYLSLLAVRKHDDAYEYANSLRMEVNSKTGAVDVYLAEALEKAVNEAPVVATTNDDRPFLPAGVKQKDLERFGVASEIAEKLTKVVGEDAFVAIIEALPSTQGEAVLDMAYGKSPDDVWKDYGIDDSEPVDVEDMHAALKRSISRLSFTTAGKDNEDELRAVLEGDLARWRVWLHPVQRSLADHDGWNGPYRVTGGAGTGKTVTAVHRVRHLARRLGSEGSSAKVLLTTFTRNLSRAIEAQLVELAGKDILQRVDVQNIDGVARKVVGATEHGRAVVSSSVVMADGDDRILELWRTAVKVCDGKWNAEFLADEWSLVVLGNAIEDEGAYLRVPRSGRSERLSRPQRADVWSAIEQFQRLMRAEGFITFTELAARAASALESDPTLREQFGYRHAVVDEAQDLHPAHWKLLRALIAPATDDLFIVGDAHQRIYGRSIPLSRYGIETRGRSKRLTINYRTSREILKWTLQVADPDVDDLDVEADTLRGARSMFGGPEPESHVYGSTKQENAGIAEIINRWRAEGLTFSDIAVFAYDGWRVNDIAGALTEAGVPADTIQANTKEELLGDSVRVMTMHRAKGLEYRGVVLARLGDKEFPPVYVRKLDAARKTNEIKRLRGVLYVAGSRARERMATVCTDEPSELIVNVESGR